MKRDVEASKAFAEGIAKAGVDAIKTLGMKVQEIGRDIDGDETGMQLLAKAALGLDRAHAALVRGAVDAARGALLARRNPQARAVPAPIRAPLFYAERAITVAISGTADYDELCSFTKGSGYEPVALVRADGVRRGIVHIYFNEIGDSPFGPYHEVFILASAAPAGDPSAKIEWKAPANPAYVILPVIGGAPNVSLKLFIDASSKEVGGVVGFGRHILGLDKEAVSMKFEVGLGAARVEAAPIGKWKMTFASEQIETAIDHLRDVLGTVPSQDPPPQTEFSSPVVTRCPPLDDDERFKAWSWDFTTNRPPLMNPFVDGGWTPGAKLHSSFEKLRFEPLMTTWTDIKEGHIDAVSFLGDDEDDEQDDDNE